MHHADQEGQKAEAVGILNSGQDLRNAVKQAGEFGLLSAGIQLVPGQLNVSDIRALGVPAWSGVTAGEIWYWNYDKETRAFAERFKKRTGGWPGSLHAGNYSAVGSLEVAAGQAPVNVALTGTASASYTPGWVTADNIADGVQPTGPVGPNTDVWNTWPQVGEQWVQLDWAAPVTVDHSRVWFSQDIDDSGAGVAGAAQVS